MISAVDAGEILGERYRVLQGLGKGRWGMTYLAEEIPVSQDRCVIQVFTFPIPAPEQRSDFQHQITQEAELLKKLDHPQIAKFRDWFISETADHWVLYWVSDYVSGQSLRLLQQGRWVQQRGFEKREIVQLLSQLLPVLHYLHYHGVIHRNLSPNHILIRQRDSLPVLVDLGGIQQIIANQRALSDPPSVVMVGQVGYAPPEQFQKGIIFTYSDLYALAAVLLVLLTGQPPEVLLNPETGNWEWQQFTRFTPKLQGIFTKMLAKRPGDRFQNAYDVMQMLQDQPTPPPPPRRGESGEGKRDKSKESGQKSSTRHSSASLSPQQNSRLLKRSGMRLLTVLSQFVLVLGFVVAAGAIGWWFGNYWLTYQLVSEREILPELDDSPPVSPPPLEEDWTPENLSFPLTDDPEPDPDESLPLLEQERKLALRQRRLNLTIDYEFFQQLVQQQFLAQYPERRGRRLSNRPEDMVWRDRWDETATQVLDQLMFLSGEARRGLGSYRRRDRERWEVEVQRLDISPRVLYELTDRAFFHRFPEHKDRQFLNEPIGQVWNAIALEKLRALRSGSALQKVSFPSGEDNVQLEGELDPGQGQVFLLRVEANQRLSINAITDRAVGLSLYAPNGQALLSGSDERAWSDTVNRTGLYEVVLLSRSAQSLNYRLSIKIENP
ncbi:serine/threonine protein kinase [Spirulina subsalsa]|uniref:serine/threonine protein kinase n=1 Tax=Spirulina subsalsa TaxID=54311 RepID=UPI0002D99FD6|nr:protein kinase [Spirulina subsalsa]